MNAISRLSVAGKELTIVVAFGVLCASIFGFLWIHSGGKVPFTKDGYQVTVAVPRAGNTVYFSDVEIAGVKVGKVQKVQADGNQALITFSLDPSVAPLHAGATVQIGSKSLVEESYLNVSDGSGSTIPAGATLPAGSGRAPVQLDDVYRTLNAPTRASIQRLLQSSGAAVQGTQADVAAAAQGLGMLGRNGQTALDAIAAQSADLNQLARNTAGVLAALSTHQLAISQLVEDAHAITEVTAGESADVQAVMRALPPTMASLIDSSGAVSQLSQALTPVAHNLRLAAPDLTAALREVPQTARDLRATMPYLNGVLTGAAPTLTQIPQLSNTVTSLVAPGTSVLSNLDPMLSYLSPYGPDLAAFFSNFAATLGNGDKNGSIFRLMVALNDRSLFGNPLNISIGPLNQSNALPRAGSLQNPSAFSGVYPHVTKQAVPQ